MSSLATTALAACECTAITGRVGSRTQPERKITTGRAGQALLLVSRTRLITDKHVLKVTHRLEPLLDDF